MNRNLDDEKSEFLMDSLKDVSQMIQDPNLQAYAIVTTIASCGDNNICESLLRMYIAPLSINVTAIVDHLAWFSGGGLINIDCDCSHFSFCLVTQIQEHEAYKEGMVARINETDHYKTAGQYIEGLKENLFKEA